jgi:hypothetical protein
MAKQPKSYTAPHPVFTDGQYFKAGEVFVTADTKGEQWEEVTTAEKRAIESSQGILEAGDAPIDNLSIAALQALAVEKRVNPEGLSKKQLVSAIRAADEPRL